MLIFVRKKVHLGDSLLGVLQMTEDRMNRMAMSSPAIDRVLTLHALPAPVEKAIFLLGQRKEEWGWGLRYGGFGGQGKLWIVSVCAV